MVASGRGVNSQFLLCYWHRRSRMASNKNTSHLPRTLTASSFHQQEQGLGAPQWVSSTYFDVPKRGTQLWIDELIVKQNICPFVKNSHIEITVCPPKLKMNRILDFMVKEVLNFDQSESPPGKYSCRLIVFPERTPAFANFSNLLFAQLPQECEGVLGFAGANYEPRDDRMTVQATVFGSPEEALQEAQGPLGMLGIFSSPRNETLKIQRLAPWNTLQLVKFAELKKARGRKARDCSSLITSNNTKFDHEMSAKYSDEVILEYFRDIRERAKHKVIQVYQKPSNEDMHPLEQEGFTIEIINASPQNGERDKSTSQSNVSLRPRSKKHQHRSAAKPNFKKKKKP